ncbi:MAG: 7-cyano-7-deazaguanine synthase [Planctomycetota bacterium]
MNTVGVLVSGGLDSCILLGHLAALGHPVQPFYVRAGLRWEGEEMESVRRFCDALKHDSVAGLKTFELPCTDLYGRHWSTTGECVPDAHSADDAVFLPGRNALLLLKPALWCRMHRIPELALGVLGTNPFPDATPMFFATFEAMVAQATGGCVRIVRPLGELTKREAMELGRSMPLEHSFSCINPVEGLHCGRCNKCAERREAFAAVDMSDPTKYASVGP